MKIFLYIFAVIIVCSLNANSVGAISNKGDVNQDLQISATDAMLILRNSLGLDMSNTGWIDDNSSDVNCDGNSNSADAMLVLRYSVGLDMNATEWCINSNMEVIGARPIEATPLNEGTLFASTTGNGNNCSENDPCSVNVAFSKVVAGDVLFLRGGTYNVSSTLIPGSSGTTQKPIIIESYPGEIAILEGAYDEPEDVSNNPGGRTDGIKLISSNEYIRIRNIEIKHMGWSGINVYGNNNLIEGCHTHNNMMSGITIYGGQWHEDEPDYQIPYPHGNNNVIKDNISNANSDVGLSANGGNSDGIAISSGGNNIIIHNTVYANSDDGIDTWRSNDTYVAYNLVYDQGRGDGDGNGIKTGGNLSSTATNGLRAIAEHNISYGNRRSGIDYNSGKHLIYKYNTTFNNGLRGINALNDDSIIQYNIASNNAHQYSGLGTNNSWNIQPNISFISTDPNSADFLRPIAGSQFEDKGVYASSTP